MDRDVAPPPLPPSAPLSSVVCRREHFDTAWFLHWFGEIYRQPPEGVALASGPDRPTYHRKNWEWAAVAQALAERDMLRPGRRGMGFAVGREPLTSLFAVRGASVVATDLAAEEGPTSDWSDTGQHAADLEALYWPAIVSREDFDARVSFMPQDMRNLRTEGLGSFDFIWSACSFEHLGSLEAGLQFVMNSTALLKPGGIAVHTTEFNLSSPERTLETGNNVIYRVQDLTHLEARLRGIACAMEPLDAFGGSHPDDIEYDFEPYYLTGRQHIKLDLSGHVATSVLLIIRKGRHPDRLADLPALLAAPPDTPTTGPILPVPELDVVAEIKRLSAEVGELHALAARSRDHAAQLQARFAEAQQRHEQERQRAAAELEALQRSTSWRVTRPLRAAARGLLGRA